MKSNSDFFNQNNCDRCYKELSARTMSWFTDETICISCSQKENDIKKNIRKAGELVSSYEGCGYIPDI